ncbi:MAG: hypothetical protein JWM32_3011 [Verrucomicrobia bacterium]|nr:hypothetical protein [Verrucomicrobiota bacterium]
MKQKPNKTQQAYAPPVSLPAKGSPPDRAAVAEIYEKWEKEGRPLGTPPGDEGREEREMLRDSTIQADTFRRKARRPTAEATPNADADAAPTQETPPVDPVANRDEIAQRAYQLWTEGGHIEGRAIDYWLAAEREVRERNKGSSTLDFPTAHLAPTTVQTVDVPDMPDKKQ